MNTRNMPSRSDYHLSGALGTAIVGLADLLPLVERLDRISADELQGLVSRLTNEQEQVQARIATRTQGRGEA